MKKYKFVTSFSFAQVTNRRRLTAIMNLKGKSVVVVGGFGGIGLETSKCFLQKKIAKLAILDLKNDEATLKQLQGNYPDSCIIYIPLDVTKKAQIKAVFKEVVEKFGYIDILVNFSGVVDDNDPELTINVNLLGLININLTAFSHMSRAEGGKGGLIVNTASAVGLEPCPSFAIYSATKHGVIGFTRSMACPEYYEEMGISFITICPGVTFTNILNDIEGKTTLPSAAARNLVRQLISDGQKPEDCAKNLVEAVEVGKNGSIWLCDYGKLKEVHPTQYWTP